MNSKEAETMDRHLKACLAFQAEVNKAVMARLEEEERRITALTLGASTFIPSDHLEDHEIIVSRRVHEKLKERYFIK